MRISNRAIASLLTISLLACSTVDRDPGVAPAGFICDVCPSPSEVYTADGEHPIELVTSFWDTDAQECVYTTLYGDYWQPLLCPADTTEATDTVSVFIGLFACTDCECGAVDGVCPLKTISLETDIAVSYNLIWDLAKFIGALGKVAGVAKLVCVVRAALKAAKTAATALAKARGHATQLKALLTTYPNAAQRTPAIVAQIQGEAWRASANYARSLSAARLSLKKGAEALGIMTAAVAGGNYLLGSKEADEAAIKEVQDGMADAEAQLKDANDQCLNQALPDDVKATPRGRYNRAIEETQKMIDELNAIAKTRALCDDEKGLLDVLNEQKANLIKERDALGAK
jgi:hypothetical protein